MNNLEFRAWDKENKKMIYDPIEFELRRLERDAPEIPWDKPYIGFSPFDYEEFDIMQYIGKKDIKGKKIFTGDIVYHTRLKDKCIIYFNEDKSQFVWKSINHEYYIDRYIDNESMKIVGNIYEEPKSKKVKR